jgi:DNA-binding LacI/PurR family transcriptional regulator
MYEAMQEELLRLKSEYSGIYVVFETIDQPKRKLQESIEHMIADGLDTIFLNGINIDNLDFLEAYQSFIDIYVFFYLSNSIAHPNFAFGVFSDWHHGGYIGIRHLIDCGCDKILVILSSRGLVQNDFQAGALSAAEESTSEVKLDFIYEYDYDTGTTYNYEKLSKYMERSVNGIFCFKHSIAFQVYDYLKSNNYKIPEDVAVLGYYDSNLSLKFSPPLSSISVCPKAISLELLKMYRGRNKQVIIVKPKLIKRASTTGSKPKLIKRASTTGSKPKLKEMQK